MAFTNLSFPAERESALTREALFTPAVANSEIWSASGLQTMRDINAGRNGAALPFAFATADLFQLGGSTSGTGAGTGEGVKLMASTRLVPPGDNVHVEGPGCGDTTFETLPSGETIVEVEGKPGTGGCKIVVTHPKSKLPPPESLE